MKNLYYILLGLILLILPVSCLDDPDGDGGIYNAKAPEVETDASNIKVTATTIELAGKVIRENGRKVNERGFLYGNVTPLSFANAQRMVDEGSGKGDFSGTITQLLNDTVYYVCAYAINGDSDTGRSRGEEVMVRTISGLGVVRTLAPSDVHATTALCNAQIESSGEGEILKRGFYLKSKEMKDSTVYSEDTEEQFSHIITGLKPNTAYTVQAFVENNFGIFTGGLQSFTTSSGKPDLHPILTITTDFTTATLTANLLSEGDAAITSRGFYWGKSENVIENGEKIEDVEVDSNGNFSYQLSELASGQKYFLVAYATNSFGSAFTPDTFFVTRSDEPVVNLISYTLDESTGTVTLKGKLESNGISDVTKLGFCYNTKSNSNIQNSQVLTATADENGYFEKTVALKGGATYYMKAYATNSSTTGYSQEVSLATPDIFTIQTVSTRYNKIPGTMSSFVYNNRCYLLGGDDAEGTSDELWMYSSMSNTLENLQGEDVRFPAGGRKLQAVACSAWGNAYVYGGYAEGKAQKGFYSFTAYENRWTQLPDDGPDSLYSAAACITTNGFFLIGGKNKLDNPTDDVWCFSLSNWVNAGPFPQKQSGGIAVVVNNMIYAGMGISSDNEEKKLWVASDKKLSEWTEVATMEDSNNTVIRAGVAVGKTIYVVDASGVIWSYFVESTDKKWVKRSQLPSSIAKDVHTMFVMDGTIHFGFGSTGVIVTYNPIWDN